jgi:hypothetical protein
VVVSGALADTLQTAKYLPSSWGFGFVECFVMEKKVKKWEGLRTEKLSYRSPTSLKDVAKSSGILVFSSIVSWSNVMGATVWSALEYPSILSEWCTCNNLSIWLHFCHPTEKIADSHM